MWKDFITALLMRNPTMEMANVCSVGDDDGGGGAGAGGGGNPATGDGDPGQNQPAGDGDRNKPGGTDPKESVPLKAHQERVDRAKRNTKKDLLKKYGVADEAELEQLVSKAREGESEADRLQREREQDAAERARLEQENATLHKEREQGAVDGALRGAIEAEGKPDKDGNPGRKVLRPQQVIGLLKADGKVGFHDGKVVALKSNGDPDHSTSIEKLVKSFLDDNDHFVESPIKAGGAGSHPRPGGGPAKPPINEGTTYADRKARYDAMVASGRLK